MKRTAALLFPLSLGWAVPALAADVAPGFIPPTERIEKPYTNDKCLEKCHALPGFSAGARNGALRDLHVDVVGFMLSTHGQKGLDCIDCHIDADPNTHPRTGYAKVDCRACHSEKPPGGVFPPDALKRLEQRGIKPPPKESQKADGWMKTKHAKAWLEKNPAAPFCNDCHTAHSIRKSSDPDSTVSGAHLAQTCGKCHVDQVLSYDVGGLFTRFRIGAHGKGDLSNRYDIAECVSCHQGEAAHGEETVTKQSCPKCHKVPERRPESELASLHIKPLASDQPISRALRWLYTLGFWGVVAVGALFALFMGFSSLYRKKDEG